MSTGVHACSELKNCDEWQPKLEYVARRRNSPAAERGYLRRSRAIEICVEKRRRSPSLDFPEAGAVKYGDPWKAVSECSESMPGMMGA